MDRVPGQGYPGSDYTPPLTFVASLSVSRLYTSPNAVQFAWYRAIPDPTYSKESGTSQSQAGRSEYMRELQPGLFWCILSDSATVLKKYMAQGTWEQGSVAIDFDPASSPLSIYDWIVPMSQDGLSPASCAPPSTAPLLPAASVRARTYTQKDTIVRGAGRVAGVGTITTAGRSVGGDGTAFATFFKPGDIFLVASFAARVLAVTDDTQLTLDAAPPFNFSNISYSLGRDTLPYSPVASVALMRSATRSFTYGRDFLVVSGFPETLVGDYIQWLNPANSPAPGETFSIIYNYLARYELTNYGQKAPVVGGQSLLSSQVATLWKPQTSPNQ